MDTRRFVAFLTFAALLFTLACHRTSAPTTKRYQLKGKVLSIDAQSSSANIDGEDIPGFMPAMIMPYKVKDAAVLAKLTPGDLITADMIVQDNGQQMDSWLENVKVTGHSAVPPAKPAGALHMPSPGEEVPDFVLTNQDGEHVSLKHYRGKTLLVTFIYTRCPFPDVCPRLSEKFADINRKLKSDPVLSAKTHLLSISFDPAYDTPKVLREYGFACAKTKEPDLFHHWEFASPTSSELTKLADFFALTHIEEGGVITHSLSTAVISPEGRIIKWYHGNDWQPADLIKDATSSS